MEPDDTSSNPQADDHLPASGEFDSSNVPSADNPLTSADAENDDDDEEKEGEEEQTADNPSDTLGPA